MHNEAGSFKVANEIEIKVTLSSGGKEHHIRDDLAAWKGRLNLLLDGGSPNWRQVFFVLLALRQSNRTDNDIWIALAP